MKVRKARKKDFAFIGKMMKVEYGKHFGDKWKDKDVLKVLNGLWGIVEMYVAEEGGKVIGFVSFREKYADIGNTFFIEELVVNGKVQGKGIGRMLLDFVDGCAKKKGVKFIWLFTGKNSDAFKFYKKVGYKYGKNTAFLSKEVGE